MNRPYLFTSSNATQFAGRADLLLLPRAGGNSNRIIRRTDRRFNDFGAVPGNFAECRYFFTEYWPSAAAR
jgi:hypothetical protein